MQHTAAHNIRVPAIPHCHSRPALPSRCSLMHILLHCFTVPAITLLLPLLRHTAHLLTCTFGNLRATVDTQRTAHCTFLGTLTVASPLTVLTLFSSLFHHTPLTMDYYEEKSQSYMQHRTWFQRFIDEFVSDAATLCTVSKSHCACEHCALVWRLLCALSRSRSIHCTCVGIVMRL